MDEETGKLYYTHVACRLLDRDTCRCGHYDQRAQWVPGCAILTPTDTAILKWMPDTCAYRRVYEGRPLSWWHPLLSGSPETVHVAGISVRGRTMAEEEADLDALEFHLIDWIELHQSDN